MSLFLWKGPKPIAFIGDQEYESACEGLKPFFSSDGSIMRAMEAHLAIVSVLAAKIGEKFTPELWSLMQYEADETAAFMVNDAFLALDDNQLMSLLVIHYNGALRAMGLGSIGEYGIEDVVLSMVTTGALIAQAGRGHPFPAKLRYDELRTEVQGLLDGQHATIPRDHAAPILTALTAASVNHPDATRVFTGGAVSEPATTAVRT